MLQALTQLIQLLKRFYCFVKLDIDKLTNVPTSLNNLKTKIDDLDVGKLNTTPADLKKLGDVEDNEVVKNTTLSKRKFLIQLLY